MPHFVIDCSENIIEEQNPDVIMQAVFDVALATDLFEIQNIKVRINPFKHFIAAKGKVDFIHVFGNIMGGRNVDQKKLLSNNIVSKLKELFPELPVISMNIIDFDKATYCNQAMV